MTAAQIAIACWTIASISGALLVGSVIALAKLPDCCPHDVGVPDHVPAEWTGVQA